MKGSYELQYKGKGLKCVLLAGLVLAGAVEPAGAVQFGSPSTLQSGIGFTTAIDFGPEDPVPATSGDGCVYALNGETGEVHRICFDAAKVVNSDSVVVDLRGALNVSHGLGLAFDPTSDPDSEIHLYISYASDGTAPFNGSIARAVSTDGGVTYVVDETFITGLSRSEDPPGHNQVDGLAFGPDGCLYIAQGSNSNSGYSAGFAESRLSGAVVRACFKDVDGTVSPTFDRDCGGGDLQEACDLEVYASGFRNPYDLVWHSNGRLYATDNDPSLGFGLDCGTEANNFGCPCQEPAVEAIGDELNLIEQGFYYGSPNPYRAMPNGLQCLGGSNANGACSSTAECPGGSCEDLSALCTDGLCGDISQCYYFGFGEDPLVGEDPNGIYRAPILQISDLLDGVIEYRSRFRDRFPSVFSSDWDGDLLATGGPGSLRRLRLSADGQSATDEGTASFGGASGLDVVVGPDGTIYVADFLVGRVIYLRPNEQPDPEAPDFFTDGSTSEKFFCDDFNRTTLGSNWAADNLSFSIVGNRLVEDSGATYAPGQLRWASGSAGSVDQFGKIQVFNPASDTFGFMFRINGTPGAHYEIHLPGGSLLWRWERCDPLYLETKANCWGDAILSDGDYVGATIEGVGSATKVSVWRWSVDPDGGGSVNIFDNWGPPDCTMEAVAAPHLDTGVAVGTRAYAGPGVNAVADNWCGGSLGVVSGATPCLVDSDCDDGLFCNGIETCVDSVCNAGSTSCPSQPCDEVSDGCTAVGTGDSIRGGLLYDRWWVVNGAPTPSDDHTLYPPAGVKSGSTTNRCKECHGWDYKGADGAYGAGSHFTGVPGVFGSLLTRDETFELLKSGSVPNGHGFGDLGLGDTDLTDLVEFLQTLVIDTDTYVDGNGSFVGDETAGGVNYTSGIGESKACTACHGLDGTAINFGTPQSPEWIGTIAVGNPWELLHKVRFGNPGTVMPSWMGFGGNDQGAADIGAYAQVNFPVECTSDAHCDDGNVCTDDTCPATTFCDHSLNIVPCDDGDVCTGNDACSDGVCVGGAPDHCGDGVLQVECGEQCDDGGLVSGDGCSSACTSEGLGCTAQITRILNSSGAGAPGSLIDPNGVVVDSLGNVFVAACGRDINSEGVFKVTPAGVVTKIAGGAGDGVNPLTCPVGIGLDGSGNVIAAGFLSENVFRIAPDGTATPIIGPGGDGANALSGPLGLAVDAADNVYVGGNISDNVFRITPAGAITEMIDAGGDGNNPLSAPFGVAVDGLGNVFVAGFASDNVFRITPGGAITQIMDVSGDGLGHPLGSPHAIAVDGLGNCYVTGNSSDNAFKITPGGAITEIIDIFGDGTGNLLNNPTGIAVDGSGNVYVAAWLSENGFRISPSAVITKVIDSLGDAANAFYRPADFCVAVDGASNVFMAGTGSDNVFKISGLGAACGNGVVDSCEECDDGAESAFCDADCTYPVCGDGIVNTLALEQCELDADCFSDELCASDCSCVPAPVCGNSIVEPGEACDDGGATATCDVDCTLPVCGDGILNLAAGEVCENDSDCQVGDVCQDCSCVVPPPGQVFCDNFDRPLLGPNWAVDALSFSIVGDQLVEDSGAVFRAGQLRWVGGNTGTVDQFGKIEVVNAALGPFGFMLRVNGAPGEHYEVHLPGGTQTWRWERCDPQWIETKTTCVGDAILLDGDYVGATIEGTGPGTKVSVWRWDGDPDGGGPVDIPGNWGPPDCIMEAVSPPYVDTGNSIGTRAYAGGSTAVEVADNWCGGDVVAVSGSDPCVLDSDCDDGDVCNGAESCDLQGVCQPGAPLACDDGDSCNGTETCGPIGGCQSGIPPNCDDGNTCTDDSCDPVAGCRNVDNTAPCDDGVTCTADDVCSGGVCAGADSCSLGEECDLVTGTCIVPPAGQVFCDDFNRALLGPNWAVDALSFSIVGDQLVEDSGAKFKAGQLRWVGGNTDTVDQFGKVEVVNAALGPFGFMFRVNAAPGEHYEVHLPGGTPTWRWERYNPQWMEAKANCAGDAVLLDGDYVGATIEGTGLDTKVSVWRWDGDPDGGGPVDILNNWGPPDCIMEGVNAPHVDTGTAIGTRTYAGSSTANEFGDNWCGGDVSGGNGNP